MSLFLFIFIYFFTFNLITVPSLSASPPSQSSAEASIIVNLLNSAEELRAQGYGQEALKKLKLALRKAKSTHNHYRIAQIQSKISFYAIQNRAYESIQCRSAGKTESFYDLPSNLSDSEKILKILEKTFEQLQPYPLLLAEALNNLANILAHAQHQFLSEPQQYNLLFSVLEKVFSHHTTAKEIFRKEKYDKTDSQFKYNVAELFQKVEEVSIPKNLLDIEAVKSLLLAFLLYEEARLITQSHPQLQSKVLINLVHLFFRLARYVTDRKKMIDQAEDYLYQAAEYSKNASNNYLTAMNLLAISKLARELACKKPKLRQKSFDWLTDVLVIAKQLQKTEENTLRQRQTSPYIFSLAMGQLSQHYADQNQLPEAVRLINKAIFLAQKEQATDILYQWYRQRAQLATRQQNPELAIKFYREAVNVLEKQRNLLLKDNMLLTQLFNKEIAPVYSEFIDLLLKQSKKTVDKHKQNALLEEAREVVDLFRTVEMTVYFLDDCLSEEVEQIRRNRKAITDQINEKIASLPPKTAVLHLILLPERMELLLTIQGKETEAKKIISKEEETTEKTQRHIFNSITWLKKQNYKRGTRYLGELYRVLIKPIEQELQSHAVDTLVIVPDSSLRNLSFASLWDDQEKKYLIQKYALASIPSLLLTPLNVQRTPLQGEEALLGGLPAEQESVPRFSRGERNHEPLKFVKKELESIQKILDAPPFLVKDKFTKQHLTTSFNRQFTKILHLATHAYFNPNPNLNYVVLHGGKKLYLQELATLIKSSSQPLELITLSACQTAKSKQSFSPDLFCEKSHAHQAYAHQARGDLAAMGLAGVAVKSGARSAVATLWSVEDESAAELMIKFYEELTASKDISKAKALQRAQIKLLQEEKFNSPYAWGAFFITGNWL